MDEVKSSIRTFICVDLGGWDAPESDLSFDRPLIEERIVDSLGIYELVTFLENRFGVAIDDLELIAENFQTIDAMAALVASKRS